MKKKVISAILCGAMVLGTVCPVLAADDKSEDTKTEAAAGDSAKGKKIALVGKAAGNAFFEIAAKSFQETVEAEGGEVQVVYPETMGGAVVMNAGAYGGEMKDVLTEVTVMDEEGEIVTLPADKLELGYRTSIIKTAGYIVLEAKLQLKEGNPEVIRETMKDLTIRRTTKQPLEYPSAGSTFKRPEGYFAGKLIMDSGLAGYQVGGAQVSEKHCGFVINAGGATARDVRTLMDNVRDIVYKKYGVTLEPEVKFLGDFEA